MSDEQYHEFHLEGKQMVFLFMAGLTVVVVSFLCGVMVGGGIRVEPDQDALARAEVLEDPTSVAGMPGDPVAEPSVSDEQGSAEALSYFSRLNDADPVTERLAPQTPELLVASPPPPPPAPAPPPASEPVRERPRPATRPSAPPASQVASADPAPAAVADPTPAAAAAAPQAGGFVVQVVSVARRQEADTMAQRLASKGYPSFVQAMPDGRFRVRVGWYPDRQQADTVARRLEREEKIHEPWVDR